MAGIVMPTVPFFLFLHTSNFYLQSSACITGAAPAFPAPLDIDEAAEVCIPADTGSRRGAAEIMLRPEQRRLAPVPHGGTAARRGQVTAVEFGDAACKITVALTDGGDPFQQGIGHKPISPLVLRLHSSSPDLPDVGAQVGIAILGKAHIFAQHPIPPRLSIDRWEPGVACKGA